MYPINIEFKVIKKQQQRRRGDCRFEWTGSKTVPMKRADCGFTQKHHARYKFRSISMELLNASFHIEIPLCQLCRNVDNCRANIVVKFTTHQCFIFKNEIKCFLDTLIWKIFY